MKKNRLWNYVDLVFHRERGKGMSPYVPILITVCLTSCAGTTTVSRPQGFHTEHVKQQNYEVGHRKTAYVGESMVRVKDFLQLTATHMRPDKAFTLSKWLDNIPGGPGDAFKIAGHTEIEGRQFTVLDARTTMGSHYGLLVGEDGRLDNRIVTAWPFNGVFIFNLSPPDVRFVPTNSSALSTPAGENYELVYAGLDGDTIRITYREYTGDDLARSPFFQQLSYNRTQPTIRFKRTVIEVHAVTNELIDFTVVQDK